MSINNLDCSILNEIIKNDLRTYLPDYEKGDKTIMLPIIRAGLDIAVANAKKAKDVVKDGTILGIGGSIGGIISGYIVPSLSNEFLQYLFIVILIFSIFRIFYSPAAQNSENQTKSTFILLVIGFFIGILAMSIGVGGSILLTPILVGYLKYDLKAAAALGLFFVIFSSIAGFISTSYHGQMLFVEGATVGIGSLIGVYFGIKVKDMVKATSYKNYVLLLNVIVLIIMLYKTI